MSTQKACQKANVFHFVAGVSGEKDVVLSSWTLTMVHHHCHHFDRLHPGVATRVLSLIMWRVQHTFILSPLPFMLCFTHYGCVDVAARATFVYSRRVLTLQSDQSAQLIQIQHSDTGVTKQNSELFEICTAPRRPERHKTSDFVCLCACVLSSRTTSFCSDTTRLCLM